MIICANFKTNHTRKSVKTYVDNLRKLKTSHKIRVYPPSSALFLPKCSSNVKFGVQNFYPTEKGSFTGEIGEEQLNEFDINCVLIGHSERRHVLGESDELIVRKFDFAKKRGWEINYCIGEPKDIRDKGEKSVLNYLESQLKNIDLTYKNLIIAYEPVWAIGTGDVAKTEDIEAVLNLLRAKTSAPLLYGGSVTAQNVSDTFHIQNCDGVLVGTASLDVDSFKQIILKAD